MKFLRLHIVFFALLFLGIPTFIRAQDWPIFKGNIYFTGNNDEIIVKNNNLKWLFQADERVFNPIVSDGKVYFIDKNAYIYCLDEEYGTLIWKVDIRKISSQFKAFSRAAGKIKYPLIKKNTLFLTDPIAIYALNKNTGKVLWARTGMRMEKTKPQGLTGYKPLPMVDGIYSDPMLFEDTIIYGTRNMVLARETRHGRPKWENRTIKSYSGFPTFYDEFVFTQSMNFKTGRYTVHCLDVDTGRQIWEKRIHKPMKIYPPVIYKRKVYIPTSTELYCLNVKTGETEWIKDYGKYITSTPSFTDRALLFVLNNSEIVVIRPSDGSIEHTIAIGEKSGPKFVTIRNQLYVAFTEQATGSSKNLPYGRLQAVNFSEKTKLWEYKTPFPGAISQPTASKGIMFFPAGNYLYAIGTEYYPRIVQGGSGHAVVPGNKNTKKRTPPKKRPGSTQNRKQPPPKVATRKMDITIKSKDKQHIPARVEVSKRDNKGRIVYHKTQQVSKPGKIDVPVGDNVEVVTTSKGYVPKKVIIHEKDKKKTITLDKIETGKSYIVDNLLFEFNQAYLKKESLNILDQLVHIMKENKALKVEVRGYTDAVGDSTYNQQLSEQRADAVVEYLVKHGISPERLQAKGFGEKNPVASNNTERGRQKNRRTEFYFVK